MKAGSNCQRRIALIGAECKENLALRYIQAALEQEGHHVQIIPFNSRFQMDSVARELAEAGADLAGFSMVFTYRAREFAQLAACARQRGYQGHLVAGGHFAAFHATDLLRDVPALDSVAIGEGEPLMVTLAAHLPCPETVPGLVWRGPGGRIIANAPAGKSRNLDRLAWPTHKEPPDQYLDLPIANMLSSRGCGYACDFCSIAAWHQLTGGERIRLRAIDCVADEMATLYGRGYRIFNFHDDNFLFRRRDHNLARIWRLTRALRARAAGRVALAIKSRPDSVDRDVFELLRELGVFRVFVGIEAGTEESLRQLGRKQTVAENDRALEVLDALDFHACFNLLLLNPDSTLDDFCGNIGYLQRHAGHPLNFCRTEVYAGTPLEQRLREQGRLRGDYWGYGYVIADPRAQRAFELMHRLLFERHHSENNLHHLTMRVDYECRLLTHFFHCPDTLRARAKQFVVDVNLRSADFLLQIAELARDPSVSSQADTDDITALQRSIDAVTSEQMAEGAAILQAIRCAAVAPQSLARGAVHRVTTLGMAASLVVLAGTASCEAAPAPPLHAAEAADSPDTNQAQRPPPDGDVSLIQEHLMRVHMLLALYVKPARAVEVELWLNESGQVATAFLYESPRPKPTTMTRDQEAQAEKWLADLGAPSYRDREQAVDELKKLGPGVLSRVKELSEQSHDPEVKHRCSRLIQELGRPLVVPQQAELMTAMRSMSFPVAAARGKRFVFTVAKSTLEELQFPTHICEMAPAPGD